MVLSLGKGEYEIDVALDDDKKVTLTVHPLATSKKPTSEHPLLRALMGVKTHDDASVHVVGPCSSLELVTFLRLVSAAGSFHAYADHFESRASGSALGRVPPRVLIVAGSDSGGGAGVQADTKACTNLGVFSSSAITAVTVQNTLGVHAIHALPASAVADQMTCVLDDIGADVVKVSE